MADEPARTCWVVSDGRRGIENQALGLAEAVGRLIALDIRRKIAPRPTGPAGALAAALRPGRLEDLQDAEGADAASGPPDVWIGCGRASLRYAAPARAAFGPSTFIVQAQDPKGGLDRFDLVIPPAHDLRAGANVYPILGAPNRIDPAQLAEAAAALDLAGAPPPRAAVLIGGNSKRHRLDARALEAILRALEAARAAGFSLLVTTSRRTPAAAVERLRAELKNAPSVRLWTSEADGPNPYMGFLGAADVVLATRDSTNMITEAASAGKPVYLLAMSGSDGKLSALYAELAERGALKEFEGEIAPWPVEPLRETDRAATEIVARAQATWRRT